MSVPTPNQAPSPVIREQVDILYRHAFTGLGAGLALATIVLFGFRGQDTLFALPLWYGLLLSVTLLRLALVMAYRRRDATTGNDVSGWGRAMVLANGAGGIVWGLAGAGLFLSDSPIHQVMLAMVLAGITAGAAPLYAVQRYSYEAFYLPALLPFALMLFQQGEDLYRLMAAMILVYMIVLSVMSRRIYATVDESLQLRFQNSQLVSELLEAKGVTENTNRRLEQEVEAQREIRDKLQSRNQLLNAIREAQSRYLEAQDPRALFDSLLATLLSLTDSEYGFIGEVRRTPAGELYLKSFTITNIAWNDETRRFYAENAPGGLEFFNMDSLFGAVITTGARVIANDPANDPRACGIPEGHPSLNAFLGLPFFHGGVMLGMVGIANRPGGYDEEVVAGLEPFLNTCASIIHAYRSGQEQEKAEREMRDSESRLRAIVDNVADGIITLDAEGTILSFNRAAEQIFAVGQDEIKGRNCQRLIDAGERESFAQWFRTRSEPSAKNIIQAFSALRGDGTRFPMEMSVSAMELAGNTLFVGVLRDVTERHKVDRLKNEFISTVSHELRTPLTAIRGTLSLLAGGVAGELPEQARSLVEMANNNSERLVRLVNDILDMEKIESGGMQFNIKPEAVMPLIQDAVRNMQDYGVQLGVRFDIRDALAETVTAQVDHDRFLQVINNLLSNAAKFSPKDSTVEVSARQLNGMIRITVSDRGPGIAEDYRDRIFEKFTQVDGSNTRAVTGTGLGLSISKAIVERLGGSIDFISTCGRGTDFFFDVPASAPQH